MILRRHYEISLSDGMRGSSGAQTLQKSSLFTLIFPSLISAGYKVTMNLGTEDFSLSPPFEH